MKVLYHAGCADGFCAAWVVNDWLTRSGGKAEFIPVNYGDSPPPVKAEDVMIVDFSYKRPVLEKMLEDCNTMVLIDHHTTAEKELAGLTHDRLTMIFKIGRSGGMLTWGYCFGDVEPPWIVKYTEDRDLWNWKLPQSKAVSAFLSSHPFDFQLWTSFHGIQVDTHRWANLVNEGNAILRYQKQTIDNAVKTAREIEFEGEKVLCTNCTNLVSEICGGLAVGRPFGMTWFQKKDGKYVFSLRSTEEGKDVSEIAKRHGGGGHPHAAGFEINCSLEDYLGNNLYYDRTK